ncbi:MULTISPECIES: lysis protein [unclassified Methylophaga]|jgi:prophage endopeptidase|uniref:lysis protein n=1 Tax=unclassified Methylophaga TaxID=2629249 RepID=UPI00259CD4E3|nr:MULTISPECIES: lysis protein [unclassified Methylophaga]|tara:strand:- start:1636 stop:2130 length:495 start_codon:yes stop_codon:yes gene_type:complete
MNPLKPYILIGLFFSGLSIGVGTGWWINGLIKNAEISNLKTAHSNELKSISEEALNTQQSLQAELDANEKLWATAEAIQYRKLRDAENEINQLRDDVAAGRKRLLINATCPAGSDNVPETSSDTSMGERAAPRLTKDAERYYYTLVEQIVTMTAQLRYYQARCE